MTLFELGKFCGIFKYYAEIDGDRKTAMVTSVRTGAKFQVELS